jgi:hypothetical protein
MFLNFMSYRIFLITIVAETFLLAFHQFGSCQLIDLQGMEEATGEPPHLGMDVEKIWVN